jgi:hypothetical protein
LHSSICITVLITVSTTQASFTRRHMRPQSAPMVVKPDGAAFPLRDLLSQSPKRRRTENNWPSSADVHALRKNVVPRLVDRSEPAAQNAPSSCTCAEQLVLNLEELSLQLLRTASCDPDTNEDDTQSAEGSNLMSQTERRIQCLAGSLDQAHSVLNCKQCITKSPHHSLQLHVCEKMVQVVEMVGAGLESMASPPQQAGWEGDGALPTASKLLPLRIAVGNDYITSVDEWLCIMHALLQARTKTVRMILQAWHVRGSASNNELLLHNTKKLLDRINILLIERTIRSTAKDASHTNFPK